MTELRICPICGKKFDMDHAALSRTDNATYICSDCGVRQALESIGMTDKAAQDKVLDKVNEVRQ